MPGLSFDMSTLKNRLSNLLLRETLSDVVFLVGGDPFPCHKLVLALGSKVFEAMLYGKMAEKCDVIRVPDLTKKGFTIMLRYLYSDEVHLASQSEAFETAYVAQKYMIDSLFKACETYLVCNANLDSSSVIPVLEEAAFLDMRRLQGRCLRYVSRNASRVLQSHCLTGTTTRTMTDVLQLQLMDIESEVEIMEAVWLWGKERCSELDLECSAENVRDLTKDFLVHVRFMSLGKKVLEEALERFPLLNDEDTLAVLWNRAMPRSGEEVKVPDGLCGVSRTRSVANCSKLELPTEYRYDGSLTVFSIQKHVTTVQVMVTGPQVTIVGFVLTYKPIPCYSPLHRSIDFELRIANDSTRLQSSARLLQKDDEEAFERMEQELLLEDYVVVSEGDTTRLRVEVEAEGIRLMQCVEKEFACRCGDAVVNFRFDESDRVLFPFKELMCVVQPLH